MKNHLIYTLSGMLFLLTSCDAFLNQEPLDQTRTRRVHDYGDECSLLRQ